MKYMMSKYNYLYKKDIYENGCQLTGFPMLVTYLIMRFHTLFIKKLFVCASY